MLAEKGTINKDACKFLHYYFMKCVINAVEVARVLRFDEMNKKLLSQICIKIVLEYEEELKRCFTLYHSENLLYGKMVINYFKNFHSPKIIILSKSS